MLRASIYINFDEIDNIEIVNMKKRNKKGETLYKVKDNHQNEFYISHKRENGWEALLIQALEVKLNG